MCSIAFLPMVQERKAVGLGALEKQKEDEAAPATERQASRSTQQADAEAENAALQMPKQLGSGGPARPDSITAVKTGAMSAGKPAVQSPSGKTGGADPGTGGAGGVAGSEGGGGVSVEQTEVDAESAALQLPQVADAAQQVRVDEESAQLQRPETAEVVKQAARDAESAQLQTQGAGKAAEWPPAVVTSGGTGQVPKRIGKVNKQGAAALPG